MFPINVCPATCELCGNWLPQHQSSCPRNGVHPSQWTSSINIEEEELIYMTPTFHTETIDEDREEELL